MAARKTNADDSCKRNPGISLARRVMRNCTGDGGDEVLLKVWIGLTTEFWVNLLWCTIKLGLLACSLPSWNLIQFAVVEGGGGAFLRRRTKDPTGKPTCVGLASRKNSWTFNSNDPKPSRTKEVLIDPRSRLTKRKDTEQTNIFFQKYPKYDNSMR
ncbi:Uncharacterized protein TCM_001019 [Theobroma cacao]|uniref:Uncharacterized protein n=1 Tax=Theobroma cacao TaxID=3641 RepID=A0A061DJ66_THECC|nr:Uncharacterized protein TCM_001019 [Theobroma cacao]